MTIGASVRTIGARAFTGCSSLSKIRIYNDNPKEITVGTSAFNDVLNIATLEIPSGSMSNYNSTYADPWKLFTTKSEFTNAETLTEGVDYTTDENSWHTSITYTRNVTHSNWHGFYLPFDVNVTKVSGTCATLTSVSDNTLNWETQSSGIIAAGTPFIYKPTAAGDITFSVTDATIHSCTESHPVTDNGYTLSGTYTTKSDMATTKAYALSNGNFYYTESNDKKLKPYRIYLTVPEPVYATARICSLIDGEDVTGVVDIDVDPDVDLQNKRHNLLGQPVGSGYKGIVIVNGKKTLRK